jgi:hypothetical protein
VADDRNLVVLYPEADEHDDETPATSDPKEHCLHRRVRLDTEARRVFCRECEREVDPFTVIHAWAQDWTRIQSWRKEAERRRTRARERLDEILRLERNARARLRKLDPQAKPPAKPWGEGMPL